MADSEERLAGLQAARAIAALSVAYFHSYVSIRAAFPEHAWHPIPWLSQRGYLGVDFFFAISGYVICLVCSRPSFTVRNFAIRRVFRIYPLYWIVMMIVALMIAIGQWRHESLFHFLYSMSLLPQQGAPVYDFSWTLEREMVFYALAALVVPVGGIPMLALTLFALTFVGWFYGNPWTWHLTGPSQAEFLVGVLVFIFRKPLASLGTFPLVIGGIMLWMGSVYEYPFWAAIAVAPLLAGFINIRLPWHRAPFRWLVQAGDASFSIYLLHYLVFFVAANVSVRLLSLPEWACEPWRFASILATCIISYFTWTWIEKPFIAMGNSLTSWRRRMAPTQSEVSAEAP